VAAGPWWPRGCVALLSRPRSVHAGPADDWRRDRMPRAVSRYETAPFGGIKDSGLGYKEGVQEAMKSFTNVKTYSLPWP